MTADKRSALMSRVRTKNTRPEMLVRRAIHAAGLRYRIHRRDMPGKPDIVLPSLRVAVFVHGCFWHSHSCGKGRKRPQANAAFWEEKLTRNSERDAAAQAALTNAGWSVKVVWECELSERLDDLVEDLKRRRAELRG
ncbi:very short patch repair endonuclease [Sphingomonas sp. DT-204]|uniref:very short patch repair endonuclease n=1 Tax=Sphingomonas sp. DT-204 TaxID=3396166 RepID=UPI003F1D7DAB